MLDEVLVQRHKVRVILTTHSPSTVALAPEGSVFEMSRTAPRVKKSESRASAISLLTAGLVTVSPSTRFVLVEDQEDAAFYAMIRDILMDWGPSKDLMALKPLPTMAFLPVSSGSGSTKIGGGCSVVKTWVGKLDAPPLSELFRGIIDLDEGNAATARIHVLKRYSVENYLLDPFVVFAVGLEAEKFVPIAGVGVGTEHIMRTHKPEQLQSIVDFIETSISGELGPLSTSEKTRVTVSFTNGIRVEYPNWMITRRGHDLLPMYQKVLGGPKVINPPRLLNAFRRVRLIPLELAKILHKLQN